MAWHVEYINSQSDLGSTSLSGSRSKSKDNWTRDYAGPYATRAEALDRARKIKAHGALKVRVTEKWGR
jgi:hypothetical protein